MHNCTLLIHSWPINKALFSALWQIKYIYTYTHPLICPHAQNSLRYYVKDFMHDKLGYESLLIAIAMDIVLYMIIQGRLR